MLGNLSDFNPNTDMVEYDKLEELDKWALIKLNDLVKTVNNAYETYDYHIAYQNINKFCVIDMSNTYLDIIKDRLYTLKPNDVKRRACQTVMYEILITLTKILTPILAFTSEEIWQCVTHKDGVDTQSPLLSDWPTEKAQYENTDIEEKWNKILSLKEEVAKHLETARANKVIGHSLNAKVVLTASKQYDFISQNLYMLKDVFIVSQVVLEKDTEESNEVKILIDVADGHKCERCWCYSTTVGENEKHPTLCDKCANTVE